MKMDCEFNRSEDSYNLLRGLGSQDIEERNHCFKIVVNTIDSWFLGFGSPGANLENSMESNNSSHDNSMHYLIDQLLPDILRQSVTSPYEDVRQQCVNLLVSLQKRSFKIPIAKYHGVSNFIPNSEFKITARKTPLDLNDECSSLLCEYYEDWGRLENYILLMSCHPRYLSHYMKIYHHLFRGDGSLPYVDRYYVAIMAAAQMHNQELINRFITEFLSCSGDPKWLSGLNRAPDRLKAIAVLCQYLCHQPWEIEPKNIAQLIHGPSGSFHITLSQLMHAVVIMTHVASLATLLCGCGVNHELDHDDAVVWSRFYDDFLRSNYVTGANDHQRALVINSPINNGKIFSDLYQHQQQPTEDEVEITEEEEENGIICVHKRPKKSQQSLISDLIARRLSSLSDIDDDSKSDESQDCPVHILMERLRQAQEFLGEEEFSEIDMESMFRNIEKENETLMRNNSHPKSVNPLIERFVNDSEFTYNNFSSSQCSVLRSQDYSWSDEACSLAERFYPDIGRALEEKFNSSNELTYNTMGTNKDIDTTLFRLSVWIYVHSLYGIRHDDFNYSQLDNLLTKPLKLYIKKVATKPCTVRKSDFLKYLPELQFSEKIHVGLMIADARQQACLLHILKAMKSVNK